MRHIGGETLDGVEALPQRIGHGDQRAGQFADLVAAFPEIGNLVLPVHAETQPFGRRRQPLDGPRDGARQIEGQQGRHREDQGKHLHDVQPDRADILLDRLVGAADYQGAEHLAVTLHRHPHRQMHAPFRQAAARIGRLAL